MSLFISSLNSGSNGNCYYVGNGREAVLIDAGISCREVERRMRRLALDPQRLKGIFVSHEHSDHIRGIEVLSKKYQVPVYITAACLQNSRLRLEPHLLMDYKGFEKIHLGSLCITAFPKHHDACDPYSFIVNDEKIHVGIFTDIGVPCKNLLHHFKLCHAAFLEANYDTEMLQNGNYPYHLKKRISGGRGHLSNQQSLDVFLNHRAPWMTHLLLAHLSKNNNCPKLVKDLFDAHAGHIHIAVASRDEETPLFEIVGNISTQIIRKRQLAIQGQFVFD